MIPCRTIQWGLQTLLSLALMVPLQGQKLLVPTGRSPVPSADRSKPTGDFSEPAEIEKRLASVSEEVLKLPAASSSEERGQLQQYEAICRLHLAAVDVVARAREKRDQAKATLGDWRGLPAETPRTVLHLDEVRKTLVELEESRHAVEAQLRIFNAEIENTRDRLLTHQKAQRRFQDESGAVDSAARLLAERSAKSEELSSKIVTENVARLTLRLDALRAEIEMIDSKTRLAKLESDALADKVSFPKMDFDAVLQRISEERTRVIAALAGSNRESRALDPLLGWKVEFLELEQEFWTARFNAFDHKDSALRKQAMATFKDCQSRLKDWHEVARLRMSEEPSEAIRLDLDRLREVIKAIKDLQLQVGFAIADLEGGHVGTPVLDRLMTTAVSLWETELYLAEQTEIVDGKKVSTYRAVTLGKLVRLALILVVGWQLLKFLSRRMRKFMAGRTSISPTSADLAAKWSFALGLALLLIYGLNTVRIPLTALAFLGGALAIGVGFGTQTLLKNFISGIILLFERPLKVGDVIEVAGITGTIKFIGIRASVIQHFDGIETLVPNSTLLENQLTNWTFSNTVIRHSILVGVAYGSPTREVSRILLAVATEHGLVKKDPSPEVRFDNFGDSSLTFNLLFWFDTRKTARGTLASDLRFMIDRAFSEAGIEISFPQRDIHLDVEKPLRVEISRTRQTRPETETKTTP